MLLPLALPRKRGLGVTARYLTVFLIGEVQADEEQRRIRSREGDSGVPLPPSRLLLRRTARLLVCVGRGEVQGRDRAGGRRLVRAPLGSAGQ